MSEGLFQRYSPNVPGDAETTDTNTHHTHSLTNYKLSTIVCGRTSELTQMATTHSPLLQLLTSLGSQDGNCPTTSMLGCVPECFL